MNEGMVSAHKDEFKEYLYQEFLSNAKGSKTNKKKKKKMFKTINGFVEYKTEQGISAFKF